MKVSYEQSVAEIEALLDRRRTAQAKMRLSAALQEYPDDPHLLLQSAWADYLDDDNETAMVTARQVLAVEPENSSARLLLFHLLSEKKDLSGAEEVIVGLLRDYPEHAPYYGRYAALMIGAMHLKKAHALAAEGLKYDPDDTDCLFARALCEFIEQPDGSAHSLRQLIARHPQSMRTLIVVLLALQQRGDFQGAQRISQELVRAQPDNEGLVEIAREMKVAAHWSMLPLWPLQRWGWAASAVIWVITVAGLRVTAQFNPGAAGILAIVAISYAVYSWVWPRILRQLIARA